MQLWVAVNPSKTSVGVKSNLSYGKMVPEKFYFVVDKMRHNTNVVIFIIDENRNITCMDSEGLDVFYFEDNYDPNSDDYKCSGPEGKEDPIEQTQKTTKVKHGRVPNK